ncbi:hypothetical protein G4G28_06560 [Massilia sp. Dwa41.01b]|nr:hypothetical protein G4G28_06560 [Massilia sp. Dwa41.01b]QNB01372.1 hypothetical protein G4G31_10285 [Massilia sp. Se16.2.3]
MHYVRVGFATAVILCIPAIAMLFTKEVNWGPGDFLVAAVLLGGTGLGLEFATLRLATGKSRVFAGMAILLAFLLVWAELAVGIVGSPLAGS